MVYTRSKILGNFPSIYRFCLGRKNERSQEQEKRTRDFDWFLDANGDPDPEAPPANYGRRRSRAVLYTLSGHYKQDRKHKLSLNKVRLNNIFTHLFSILSINSFYNDQFVVSYRHRFTFVAARLFFSWLFEQSVIREDRNLRTKRKSCYK